MEDTEDNAECLAADGGKSLDRRSEARGEGAATRRGWSPNGVALRKAATVGAWGCGDPRRQQQGGEGTRNGTRGARHGSSGSHGSGMTRGCATFRYPSGDVYEGEFLYDMKHGFGVFLYVNGDAYAGEWKYNRRHGWGMFMKANGIKYEGRWCRDVRSGFGTQSLYQNFRYAGNFERNMRHGRGVLFQPNGALYAGTWEFGETRGKHLLFQHYYAAHAASSGVHRSNSPGRDVTSTAPSPPESEGANGDALPRGVAKRDSGGFRRPRCGQAPQPESAGSGGASDSSSDDEDDEDDEERSNLRLMGGKVMTAEVPKSDLHNARRKTVSGRSDCGSHAVVVVVGSNEANEVLGGPSCRTVPGGVVGAASRCPEAELSEDGSASAEGGGGAEGKNSTSECKSSGGATERQGVVVAGRAEEGEAGADREMGEERKKATGDGDSAQRAGGCEAAKSISQGEGRAERNLQSSCSHHSNEFHERQRRGTTFSSPLPFEKLFKLVRSSSNAESCHIWSAEQVGHFVAMLGMETFAASFISHSVDGSVLPHLLRGSAEANLYEIGIRDSTARKGIISALKLLLKLNRQCNERRKFAAAQHSLDLEFRRFELPASDIILEDRVGEGGYGRVYSGTLVCRPKATRAPAAQSEGRCQDECGHVYYVDIGAHNSRLNSSCSSLRRDDAAPDRRNSRTRSSPRRHLQDHPLEGSHSSSSSSSSDRSSHGDANVSCQPPTEQSRTATTHADRRSHHNSVETIRPHHQCRGRPAPRPVAATSDATGKSAAAVAAAGLCLKVAIKIHRPRSSVGRDLRSNELATAKDFYSELSVLAQLRHPNVTLFLGVVTRPLYCIVTEYVPCGSLFDLVHRHRLPLSSSQVVRIAREIACGMAYLHSNAILHCDLKSSNILLTESGNVKLCDFGLATAMCSEAAAGERSLTPGVDHRAKSADTEAPQHLGCVGTHHWMAPEVLRGEGFTRAADVYSFGMILWEILSGRVPYQNLPLVHIVASVGYGRQQSASDADAGSDSPEGGSGRQSYDDGELPLTATWQDSSENVMSGKKNAPLHPGTSRFYDRSSRRRGLSSVTSTSSATSKAFSVHWTGSAPRAALPPALLDGVPEDVPDALLGMLEACLQPNPSARPTFEKLAGLLDKLYQSAVIDVEECLRIFFGQS